MKTNCINLSIGILLLLGSCKKDNNSSAGSHSHRPVATISYATRCNNSRQDVLSGDSIFFTTSDTLATSYRWDFGDGGSSTQKNPMHVFTQKGQWNVKLTAVNAAGTDSAIQVFTVSSAFVGEYSFLNGTCTIDSTAATDVGGSFLIQNFFPPLADTRATVTGSTTFVINRQTIDVQTGTPTPATIWGYGRIERSCDEKLIIISDSIQFNNGGPLYHSGIDTLVGN
ncbi:MAG: PKD domain-containing protein [Bacteroidetes bacterium]|nr:PKD domain-containing protein [Bacteroidota bacterium]